MPYHFLDHPSEVHVAVAGSTLDGLFGDAMKAMMEIADPEILSSQRKKTKRAISLEALDRTALLVDFLNEVLTLTHLHRETYTSISFSQLSETFLAAELDGIPVVFFGEDIKAVTHHGADVKKDSKGTWRTRIIFDV